MVNGIFDEVSGLVRCSTVLGRNSASPRPRIYRLPQMFRKILILPVAIAIALAGFSTTYAQTGIPPHAATEQAMAGDLAAQIDDELWGAIKDSEGARVFKEYIKQYPSGGYVLQAMGRLAGLQRAAKPSTIGAPRELIGSAASGDPESALWNVVFQGDSAGGYEVFLKHYPKGKYALLATSRLQYAKEDAKWNADAAEQSAWQSAESAQTLGAYAAYVARYPGGQYAALANTRGNKIKQYAADQEESLLWQHAEKGRQSDVEAYLTRYPSGRYVSAAMLRLDYIKKEEAGMSQGRVFKDCSACPEMVVIPAGSFQRGGDDQKPVHTVSFERPFAMARTEVTQSQWRAVMGSNPSKFSSCGDCPVEGISWNDAQKYVDKVSRMTGKIYRLPSEAEWEYVCRAGGRQEYCGSDDVDSVAWHGALFGTGNSDSKTHPVAQKQANAFGLYDMSGNVSEWVEDCYHETYKGAPIDGSAWTNDECTHRVLRGGSWVSGSSYARSAVRLRLTPESKSSSYGIRPVWRLP